MEYIPVKYIRAELKNFFDKHQTCTTIPSVCRLLQNDTSLLTTEYCNPFPKNVEALDDTNFQNCFFNSLYPLSKTLEAIAHDDAFSYLGETIFSKQYLFVVFLHENYALQTMHSHDYFEITYVYNGKCKLTFENDTVSLTEGNVCIIAPGTRHEAFVLDDDSFVINLSMTHDAFEAAFAPILLRRDLVSYYIQSILYKENMPNYLFIPAHNSSGRKRCIKHIAYENRRNNYSSFSSCISWLSVFMCDLLNDYQSEIRLYHSTQPSSQEEHLLLLEYIQTNFRTCSLKSTAAQFHYNKSYLSRLIRKLTGFSFIKIITDLKLNLGKELLENTKLTLNEIAEISGYPSGDYFSKAFKRKHGISAREYRQTNTYS